MSKSKNKQHRKKKFSKKQKARKKTLLQILIFSSIIIAIILLIVRPNFNTEPKMQPNRPSEIKFRKDGELSFYSKNNDQEIKTIDIEIVEEDYERERGLMFRYQMSDNVGMLFIMEQEELQSFWMRNTYISLDIIYLNTNLEIVKIQKYTQPLSDDPIPSFKKSKYVVEVVAGFCDENTIEEGDYVKYERLKPAIANTIIKHNSYTNLKYL